jgi:hypothetical protein
MRPHAKDAKDATDSVDVSTALDMTGSGSLNMKRTLIVMGLLVAAVGLTSCKLVEAYRQVEEIGSVRQPLIFASIDPVARRESQRFEIARAAAIKDFGYASARGTYVDVRARHEGTTKSDYILALSCTNCDTAFVYAIVVTDFDDGPHVTKIAQIDTEE